VLLTGATSTAQLFHSLRPGLQLHAETGGKNAIIVTATADRDEAIKDALTSAFGHAGQKCSACSLLICEAEVYDDAGFLETLRDAAASLPVGSSWDPRSVVTPLIQPARDPLLGALTRLEPGEQWLLSPRRDPANPRLWSPGVKLGVREGSPLHTTELFGPLLAVMRAEDLDDALRLANATPYGLTSGLHSLDEHEQGRWTETMAAGNLYINRPITGAIVRRQPFGGWKASSFGPGAKAGGPNYVAQTTLVMQREPPAIVCAPVPAAAELAVRVRAGLSDGERERLSVGLCSYAQALRGYFAGEHEQGSVLGERNVLRYRPCASILVRAGADAAPVDVLLAVGAVLSAGAACVLSVDPVLPRRDVLLVALAGVSSRVESVAACTRRLRPEADVTPPERVRVVGSPEPELIEAAAHALVHVETAPVLLTGRIELLRYHREQSISHRYHRYGNLAPGRLLPISSDAATSA
jgi:RHH-type transcriptional regulator, proline utilization regulon repressor / proline dehydrogenase / delta 1-pyrroline-5-carboxylate dehydrogenase